DLETICLKAMAKEPGKRYGSAGELTEDLLRWLRGEPIAARPVGRLERAWRWSKRNPAVASLLSLMLLLVLLGTSGGWLLSQRAGRRAYPVTPVGAEALGRTPGTDLALPRGFVWETGEAPAEARQSLADCQFGSGVFLCVSDEPAL